ncbi:MAG: serine protease [Pirellulales bacterium]|nr:serine protease [Pirellulales bacterium]
MLAFSLFAAPALAADTFEQTHPKVVKIYGAGGFSGMESYQSGIVISPDGYILTVFSYVLDTDYVTVGLSDGRELDARLIGADPRLEVAVLKIEAEGLPCFDLSKAVKLTAGSRVLAFSNLFGVALGDEPVSMQKGTVSIVTKLAARRGVFETPYRGPVYVIDAITNNPGAAGGALVDTDGCLAGILGKELHNSLNHTWLNYALPVEEIRKSVEEIEEGKFVAERDPEEARKPQRSLDPAALGIVLVPDVLERTPPYVDRVLPSSPAEKAGLQPDDLIILVGDRLIQSRRELVEEMEFVDYADPIELTVIRGRNLLKFTLQSTAGRDPTRGTQP